MRKLFDHIEDIHIKGSPENLTAAVTAMDMSLQNIAAGTERLAGLLLRYSNSNKGIQFTKAVEAVVSLSNVLYDASVELNEMQNEVVRYQNKIFRYEDRKGSATVPNKHMVQKVTVTADDTSVQFGLTEMTSLLKMLGDYHEFVMRHGRELIQKKDQLASIWMDRQYRVFSDHIEEIVGMIEQALKVLDEYRTDLDTKIKELY